MPQGWKRALFLKPQNLLVALGDQVTLSFGLEPPSAGESELRWGLKLEMSLDSPFWLAADLWGWGWEFWGRIWEQCHCP